MKKTLAALVLIAAIVTLTYSRVMAVVSQTATLNFSIDSLLADTRDLSVSEDHLATSYGLSLTNGTGNNQANNVFHDQRTLAASATENLDLSGVLTNAVGQTILLTKVKAIIVKAAVGNTNNVQVSMPATNGVTGLFLAVGDGVSIGPNGLMVYTYPTTGAIVTAATGDIITITNSAAGTAVTYDVIIVGVS